jgi:hypothetical protein
VRQFSQPTESKGNEANDTWKFRRWAKMGNDRTIGCLDKKKEGERSKSESGACCVNMTRRKERVEMFDSQFVDGLDWLLYAKDGRERKIIYAFDGIHERDTAQPEFHLEETIRTARKSAIRVRGSVMAK